MRSLAVWRLLRASIIALTLICGVLLGLGIGRHATITVVASLYGIFNGWRSARWLGPKPTAAALAGQCDDPDCPDHRGPTR